MKLIVTRPQPDASLLAAKLLKLGHDCTVMPLLEIVPRKTIAVPDVPFQAICLTSANGIIVLPALRNTPVFAVGPQSAAAASAAGYTHVSHHGGDVDGLALSLSGILKAEEGPLLYLSGATVSGDLEGKLSAYGFDVRRIVTYDAIALPPRHLGDVLAHHDGVLLYSPRTAKLWANAVESSHPAPHMQHITHYCLSANVAKALPQSWSTRIAESPTESALLAMFDKSDMPRT
jgi:uroporphyrinogen-III synthase